MLDRRFAREPAAEVRDNCRLPQCSHGRCLSAFHVQFWVEPGEHFGSKAYSHYVSNVESQRQLLCNQVVVAKYVIDVAPNE